MLLRKVRERFRERRLRRGSLERADFSDPSNQPVGNVDAMAAQGPDAAVYPPGYVKSYDEGRPRH